ncbi:MAG: GNAT family N-acetyltransferase [Tepidisphaeraceae bacterium]
MLPAATKVSLADILPMRAVFLQECNHQIRYNARHERGWTDSYRLTLDDAVVGYASVMGQEIADRDTLFEFYVVPTQRRHASVLCRRLLDVAGVRWIECQTNDPILPALQWEFAEQISANKLLFEAGVTTELAVPGATVRRRREDDDVFEHHAEPVGDFVVERAGQVVATGGFLLHYNPPFADLFMEVSPPHRRQGVGSYLIQELKRECYAAGRVPAARCDLTNAASRATLCKAGMRECGFMAMGRVR